MIGTTINNYIIERKLGEGGMGVVYYARHNRVDREVAIKILHNHLLSNPTIHSRFKNEANALIKLNHPNIVKIFDYVEQDNLACLIMEYINGYTLDEYIEKISGPMPEKKASSIICSILDAVQYAHDNNVFHRDIKPANIMIGKDGIKVCIMDFGIAKLTVSGTFQTTHANTQLGTPFYMSPEQVKGLPYTKMSDIYSLGVTLYEMATGKCPYIEITNLFELQSKIVNEPLPPTSKYYPNVSSRLQQAISISTQKNPEQRFQSCYEFKQFLLTPESPPQPLVVSQAAVFHEKRKKNPWNVGVVSAILVISAIGIAIVIFSFWHQDKTPTEQTGTGIGTGHPTDTTVVEKDYSKANKKALESYLSWIEDSTKKKLSAVDTAQLFHLVSEHPKESLQKSFFVELCKPYIKPCPSIFPTRKEILHDFWEYVNNHTEEILTKSRIDFTKFEQIPEKEVMIAPIPYNTCQPPNSFQLKIKFTIYDLPVQTDKEQISISLAYRRDGNKYIRTQ
jgi:serine/threonine protein kinase